MHGRFAFTLLCLSFSFSTVLKYITNDGYEYDVSALTNQDYTVKDGAYDHTFQFRLGGPLSNSACIASNPQTAVCAQLANGKTEPVGMSDQVTYTDNARTDNGFQAVFSGGSNCSTKMRSANIGLICDPATSLTAFSDEEACTVGIVFRSPEACPRINRTPGFHLASCTFVVADKSRTLTYDLWPLMQRELSFNDNGKMIYLNLCKKSPHCNDPMSACSVSGNTNHGLGIVDTTTCASAAYDVNRLIFSIEEGDNNGSAGIFVNFNGSEDGKITEAYSQKDDSYLIVVESRYVQPKIDENDSSFDVANCKFTTPDKRLYDLSSLMGVLITYEDPLFKNTFSISPCGTCGVGDNTFCLNTYTKENVGAGQLNTLKAVEHTFYGSGVIMTAENGDLCPDNVTKRKSIVTFECGDEEEPTVTAFYQGNCHYFATVRSKIACQVDS